MSAGRRERELARWSSRRGNAMVEFALAASLMLPMLFGIFQFGYAFYVYNRLMSAVRDGARYASLRTYDSSTTTPSSAFSTAVKNAAVYGDPSGGTQPVVQGLTTDRVALNVSMSSGVPTMMSVSISSYSIDAVFATVQWNNKPAASYRFEGRFAP